MKRKTSTKALKPRYTGPTGPAAPAKPTRVLIKNEEVVIHLLPPEPKREVKPVEGLDAIPEGAWLVWDGYYSGYRLRDEERCGGCFVLPKSAIKYGMPYFVKNVKPEAVRRWKRVED